MDIGKLKNNKVYRELDFCDDEIILMLKENPEFNLYIWEGYFDDIFGEPPLNGLGWRGFTRDVCEFAGAFSRKNGEGTELSDLEEYLSDLLEYEDKSFRFPETREVFNLVADFLRYAIETNQTVFMQVV